LSKVDLNFHNPTKRPVQVGEITSLDRPLFFIDSSDSQQQQQTGVPFIMMQHVQPAFIMSQQQSQQA
jgi:hypothetical protein